MRGLGVRAVRASAARTESAERKTSCCVVIGLGCSLTKSNCSAPQLGAVLGNSQAPGPTAALGWARGLDHARGPFPGAWIRPRARLFFKRGVSPRRLPCPSRCRGSRRGSPCWMPSMMAPCRTPDVCPRFGGLSGVRRPVRGRSSGATAGRPPTRRRWRCGGP